MRPVFENTDRFVDASGVRVRDVHADVVRFELRFDGLHELLVQEEEVAYRQSGLIGAGRGAVCEKIGVQHLQRNPAPLFHEEHLGVRVIDVLHLVGFVRAFRLQPDDQKSFVRFNAIHGASYGQSLPASATSSSVMGLTGKGMRGRLPQVRSPSVQ